MAHPKPYDVSFRFRFSPPLKLDGVLAFNADHAAKKARQELLARHGYTDEDFKFSLVSTSRSRTTEQVA